MAGPNVHNPSHRGVAVLAPVPKPQVGSLAENTVPDGTVPDGNNRAASSIGGNLESFAAQLALSLESGLAGGQVEKPLSTVAAHDGGLGNGHTGNGNGNHGGDAGAGQTVRHCFLGVVRAPLGPLELIVEHRGEAVDAPAPIVHKA